jgi:hypothetical protein
MLLPAKVDCEAKEASDGGINSATSSVCAFTSDSRAKEVNVTS